jgi:VirC2 protein
MGIRRPSLTVEEARLRARHVDAGVVTATRADNSTLPNTQPVLKPLSGRLALRPSAREAITSPPESAVEVESEKNMQSVKPDKAHKTKSLPLKAAPNPVLVPRGAKFNSSGDEKQQLFLSVPLPAKGISPSFDALSQSHLPVKALQMILKRALLNYERMILDGTFTDFPFEYEQDRTANQNVVVQTSRTMATQVVTIARNHFDPLGFESDRAFGRKVASAALSAFFHNETRP